MADDDRDDLFDAEFGEESSDNRPTEADGDAQDQEQQGIQARSKRSTVKVLLALLAIVAVFGILCCGGFVWWYLRSVEKTEDAETVRAWTQEIVNVDVPTRYLPLVAAKIDIFGYLGSTISVFDVPGDGVLQYTEFRGQAVRDPNLQAAIQENLKQSMIHSIRIAESETRTIDVDGEQVEFTFATGIETVSGSEWKQVTGNFTSKNGIASLMLQQPAPSYDDSEVMEMLESISTK